MSEVQETPKRTTSSAMIAVLVLLVVGLGVMIFLWSSKNSALNDCNTRVDELKKDSIAMNDMLKPYLSDNASADLLKDFESMVADYDKIIEAGRPEDQEAMKEQQDKIKGLKSELEAAQKSGKVNASLIAKLRRENETLREIMRGYVKQIDELKTATNQINYLPPVSQNRGV